MDSIKITDSDDILEMYNYEECENDSPKDLKNKRGIIMDKVSKKIVASSFGYTDLFNCKDLDKIKETLNDIKDWNFFYSVEATLLRIFNYNEKWYLVTHKKLDAFKSRWSCRDTFGDLFSQALAKKFNKEVNEIMDWFYSLLDKEKVYNFLLKTNFENRIVCQYNNKQEKILFLGTFKQGDVIQLNFEDNVENELGEFAKPTYINIDSIDNLIQKVEELNCFEYQGIIAINKNDFKQIKIFNSEYDKFYKLRANNPNLRFRYLELRNDSEKLKLLYFLYPKFADLFDQYEDTIYKISRMIYHFYVNRYIKNQFITLPKEEFLVMKRCHDWYLTDRKNNRIFSKKVLEFLSEEQPLNIYKMIKRYNLNQNLALSQRINNKKTFIDVNSELINQQV